ncbi:TolC family protein [Daejeonella oryzae]|uniref:TolC family protein n=1 Tax=Daejeonella oryzae TaxID=1122943 RepID=UPI00042227F4|nr:TolC family protein [Daejeonella oryzae]
MNFKLIKNKFFLISALVCTYAAVSVTQASAQEKITLRQATEIALQNNLQIKQAQLSEALSDENLKQSKIALYPTLNASNNLNFNYGRSIDPLTNQFVNQSVTSTNGNLFSGITLFQGFQKINLISQSKYELEADKSNTQKSKNDLVLAVVTTYLQVLNSQDFLVAANQQLAISRQQLDREQKFFDVGNKTLADLSQSKAQVATAELNVTNAQNQLDLSFLNLAQLMERDPSVPFEVEKPVIDDVPLNSAYSASEVYNTALKNYPDIKIAEYSRMAFAKAVDVAKGNFYPRLTLQGGLGTGFSNGRQQLVSRSPDGTNSPIGFVENTGQVVVTPNFATTFEKTPFRTQIDENFNQSISFGLSIPIFNNFTARSSVRRAKINLQNAEVSEQIARNSLNKVVNQAVYDLRAAERRLYSAQVAFQSSKDAFYAIDQRYTVGLANSLDLNQSQTNLNKAEFDLIQARYDLIFRAKVIDFYLGNPISF